MLNRVVCVASLLVAIVSIALFSLGAWWILVGKMDEFQGVFALSGCLLAAIVFAWRSADPAWLDPVSIVKA